MYASSGQTVFMPSTLLQSFAAKDPILSEYKNQVEKFTRLEAQVDEIQTSFIVGPVELVTGEEDSWFVMSIAWDPKVISLDQVVLFL